VPFKRIKIKSLADLLRCINLSSLLELSGWPKPGNVHRTQNFLKTRYEHFLAGIAAVQPDFSNFCNQIYYTDTKNTLNFSFIQLGKLYQSASKSMMDWQNGGNVILGHILILAPLVAAATVCLKENKYLFEDFRSYLNKIIEDATIEDTVLLYKAIKNCNPGGLGKINNYDLTETDSIEKIKKDGVTLKKIFKLSKDYDLISREYFSGFQITLNMGLPYFFDIFNEYKDINIAIVNTYLKILSEHNDTLIIRKSGADAAIKVKKAAKKIILNNGIASKSGLDLTNELDFELQKANGKLNPGTSADILAGVIFCALISGLKF